jgi:hypothetical protein
MVIANALSKGTWKSDEFRANIALSGLNGIRNAMMMSESRQNPGIHFQK